MSSLQYEFLTYEAFPLDPYVKEVVQVVFNGAVILPYQHISMKNGGSFWGFPGCAATLADGSKKRFNGSFNVSTDKIKFEADLELFLKKKSGVAIQGQINKDNAATDQQTTFLAPKKDGGEVGNDNLPF